MCAAVMRLKQTDEDTKTDTRWQLGLIDDDASASQSAVITAVFVRMQSGGLNAAVGDGSRKDACVC